MYQDITIEAKVVPARLARVAACWREGRRCAEVQEDVLEREGARVACGWEGVGFWSETERRGLVSTGRGRTMRRTLELGRS